MPYILSAFTTYIGIIWDFVVISVVFDMRLLYFFIYRSCVDIDYMRGKATTPLPWSAFSLDIYTLSSK